MLISLTEHTAKCVGCERLKLKQADTSETGKKKKKRCVENISLVPQDLNLDLSYDSTIHF